MLCKSDKPSIIIIITSDGVDASHHYTSDRVDASHHYFNNIFIITVLIPY